MTRNSGNLLVSRDSELNSRSHIKRKSYYQERSVAVKVFKYKTTTYEYFEDGALEFSLYEVSFN